MGLVSIVTDCWNTLSHFARPAVLIPAVLLGGFVSQLYAQDEIDAIKPKDLGAYSQRDREEQKKELERKKAEEQKKEEERKAEEARKAKEAEEAKNRQPTVSEAGNWETDSSQSKDSSKINTFLRAEYAVKTNDLVPTDVDHRLDFVAEFIKDDGYGKLFASGISEQGKNNGSGFCLGFRGYGPAEEGGHADKDIKWSALFEQLVIGNAEWGGIFGLGVESRILSAFLSGGGGFRSDELKIFYATPFEHHGTSKRIIVDAPFSAGVRLGDELGFELKGDIAYYHFQKEDFDLPYLDSPPTLMDMTDIRNGGYGDAILSLFYDPESKDCFLKLIAKYYKFNVRLDYGVYEKDGTPIQEWEQDYLHEEYLVNLYGFFDFSKKDKAPDALGMFNVYYNGNNAVSQFGAQIAVGCRSDKNQIVRHLIEKNQSLFTLRQMRAEKDIKDIAYNRKDGFHYDFGFGLMHQEPMPGFTTYPRQLYAIIEANLFQCTKIGNLGLNLQGRIDTITEEHPGMLQVQANLFGPLSLALFYRLEFSDASKLSAADGAKHTLGASVGANF